MSMPGANETGTMVVDKVKPLHSIEGKIINKSQ
jgi:hypothetical protein